MVVAEFAAVDQAEADWQRELPVVAGHELDCPACIAHQPCETQRQYRAVERRAWGRFYDARRDAGVL